ncbi:unnamed protein product [Litomosoides sigmodontis]|uniref:Uncharacterized protein n=1 Tax=Litomosoides sigmodontis TaxID=42156 RepID=A0A3P6VC49_LITSI|nr:unnamed protein product [Litomosoides sigmodontis]
MQRENSEEYRKRDEIRKKNSTRQKCERMWHIGEGLLTIDSGVVYVMLYVCTSPMCVGVMLGREECNSIRRLANKQADVWTPSHPDWYVVVDTTFHVFRGNSRFTSDVLDDRPLPSTLYIAQFNDNDPKFIFFKLCHAQKAAVAVAGFGMSSIILIFISAFFEFDWYNHKTGIDVMALAFLFMYLGIGVLVHYQVIVGIKKQASYYLLPFIVSYIITIDTEALFIFQEIFYTVVWYFSIHMLHIQSPSLDYSFNAESSVFYLFSITILLIIIIFQLFMLKAVCQCRYYLSCKEIHLTALKVAESSRTKYPGIHVVFTSPTFNGNHVVNIANNNRIADGAAIEQGINSTC